MNIAPAKKWRWGDFLVILAVIGSIFWVYWQSKENLNYQWSWDVPIQYVLSVTDEGLSGLSKGLLLKGFLMSLRIMVWAGIGAILIGLLIASLAVSKQWILRRFADLYVEGLRHLPPIVFMFIFFFFIGSQVTQSDGWAVLVKWADDNALIEWLWGESKLFESTVIGILCLSIFEAAFISEIFRAGFLSIDVGQWDAGKSMGLTRKKTLFLIILPQVIKKIIAPLIGHLIILVKNSAILSIISVQELAFSAQETAVSTQNVFETWIIAALLYAIICIPLVLLNRFFALQHG